MNDIHHGLQDEDGEDESYGAEHPHVEGFEVGVPRELRWHLVQQGRQHQHGRQRDDHTDLSK